MDPANYLTIADNSDTDYVHASRTVNMIHMLVDENSGESIHSFCERQQLLRNVLQLMRDDRVW